MLRRLKQSLLRHEEQSGIRYNNLRREFNEMILTGGAGPPKPWMNIAKVLTSKQVSRDLKHLSGYFATLPHQKVPKEHQVIGKIHDSKIVYKDTSGKTFYFNSPSTFCTFSLNQYTAKKYIPAPKSAHSCNGWKRLKVREPELAEKVNLFDDDDDDDDDDDIVPSPRRRRVYVDEEEDDDDDDDESTARRRIRREIRRQKRQEQRQRDAEKRRARDEKRRLDDDGLIVMDTVRDIDDFKCPLTFGKFYKITTNDAHKDEDGEYEDIPTEPIYQGGMAPVRRRHPAGVPESKRCPHVFSRTGIQTYLQTRVRDRGEQMETTNYYKTAVDIHGNTTEYVNTKCPMSQCVSHVRTGTVDYRTNQENPDGGASRPGTFTLDMIEPVPRNDPYYIEMKQAIRNEHARLGIKE